MSASPPPGWYPDPSNDQQLRWWTGERWTGAARPIQPATAPQPPHAGAGAGAAMPGSSDPSVSQQGPAPRAEPTPASAEPAAAQPRNEPAATQPIAVPERAATAPTATAAVDWHVDEDAGGGGWPKERRIALAAFGVLVLTPLLIWLIAVVLQGRGDDLSATPGESTGQEGDAETDATDEGEGEGDADGTDQAGDAGDAGDPGEAGGEQAETEPRTVDFDGRCTVDVETAGTDDDATLRPWHFDECTYAPVDLDAGQDRWIVVIASIDGQAPEEEAHSRLESYGSGYGLLWSTHYPSLNPGWWVVYDGPFSAEDDATAAADAAGGGAYPRVLSDDEGDRYCIAEDGC